MRWLRLFAVEGHITNHKSSHGLEILCSGARWAVYSNQSMMADGSPFPFPVHEASRCRFVLWFSLVWWLMFYQQIWSRDQSCWQRSLQKTEKAVEQPIESSCSCVRSQAPMGNRSPSLCLWVGDGTLPWTVPRCKMDRSRSLKESTQSNRQEDHGRSFKQKLFTEVRQRMTERTTFLTTRTYPNYEKYRTVASCNAGDVFNQVWLKVHLFRDTSWISCYYEVEPVRRDQKEEFEIHCNLKILVSMQHSFRHHTPSFWIWMDRTDGFWK